MTQLLSREKIEYIHILIIKKKNKKYSSLSIILQTRV